MIKYFLKCGDEKYFKQVSKREFVNAERLSGFYPQCDTSNPKYDEVLATNGFYTSGGILGRKAIEGKISHTTPQQATRYL